jgi:hypothetical protein
MKMVTNNNQFTEFKGFILTLFGSEQFVALLKKQDRLKIMQFFIDHNYYDKEKLKELLRMYNDVAYSSVLATIARGQIIKAIAQKKEEVLQSIIHSNNPEEIAFNKMLYNLNFFDDKRLSAVKDALNKYDN